MIDVKHQSLHAISQPDAGIAIYQLYYGSEEIHWWCTGETRHKLRHRPVIDFVGCADLHDVATGKHHDALGQCHRFHLIVGDVDRGCTDALVQLLDFSTHLRTQECVQIRQRLIEQEQFRLAYDRAPHRDALPLSARKRAGLPVKQVVDLQNHSGFPHAPFNIGYRKFAQLQAKGEIVEDIFVRVERVILEHHGDIAFSRRQVVDDAAFD